MEGQDATRFVWVGLIVLASAGGLFAVLNPADLGAPEETPAPTPEAASLQCLDGMTFRTIDEQVEPPSPGLAPARIRWTLEFTKDRFVLVRGARSEAGTYRCDGATVTASGSGGQHRGHWDAANARIVWSAMGFECIGGCGASSPPVTTGTGG